MKLFLFLVFSLLELNSIDGEYTFEALTTIDGLSQNDVLCIYQSSDDYMWFATVDGLNRYDGYEFQILQASVDGKNSMSSNLVSRIAEDQDKNLWIGTFNRGISKYNLVTEQFSHYYNTPENPDLINENYASGLWCDSKNRIWVNTYKGIYCLIQNGKEPPTIQKFQHNSENSNSLYNNITYSILEDSKGQIWVCTYSSLDRMVMGNDNTPNNKFVHYGTQLQTWGVGEVIEIEEGYVFSHHNGVHLIRFDSNNYQHPRYTELSSFQGKAMERDQYGNIWVGSHLGILLLEYQPHSKNLFVPTQHFTAGPTSNSLNHQFVRSLTLDNSGIMWIGTNGGGVSRYNPKKTKFRHYKKTALDGSISNNKVWSILEDSQDNLWLGTEGGGLNLLPASNSHNYSSGFTTFSVNSPNDQNFVFDLIELRNRPVPTLWAGTGYESKLVQLTHHNHGWEVQPHYTPSFFYIICLAQDEFGNVWTGTYDNGLVKSISSQPEQHIVYTTDNSTLPSQIIRCITEDSKGRLWIATTEGLAVIPREDKQKYAPHFTIFTNQPNDSTSLSHNYVVPIVESSNGTIWIGTFGGGLNQYVEGTSLINGHFKRYTTHNGLPSNTIKQIIEDDDGFLWISSNRGLSRFDTLTETFRNFDMSDGLQAPSFTDRSGCKRKDGEILFGGVNGFNAFYPYEISEDTTPPTLVFTNLEIFNRIVHTGDELNGRVLLPQSINSINHIRLKHSENNFTLHFAGLNYTSPQKTLYKYQLVGYDQEWYTKKADRRFATYTNLKPGKYTFRFTAANSDGFWNKIPRELHIEIASPFWDSIWFRTGTIILLVCLVFLVFQFRTQQIRKRNLELQDAVDKRTQEVQQKNSILRVTTEKLDDTNTILQTRQHLIEEQAYELKQQRDELMEANAAKDKLFSIVAHDLKDPFNALSGYLELFQLQFDSISTEEKKSMLDRAVKSLDAIRELLLNLLMWSRAQNGSIQFHPEKRNIIEIIREIIKTLAFQAVEKQIELNFVTQIPGMLVTVDRELIKTALRNILNNAIKFTRPNGNITIKFQSLQHKVSISITDNGIGIPEEMRAKLFRKDQHVSTLGTGDESGTGMGLITCKEFVELHQGTIKIESIVGEGTTVTITLPK